MTDAHRRPKTPDQTRRALLDAAARIAVDQGVMALSLPAVAAAAGVTKGALFHHFGSKQGLIEATCADLLQRIEAEIDTALAADPGGYGQFTRAYVACSFAQPDPARGVSPWASLSLTCLSDPALAQIWRDWITARLARHQETDGTAALEAVRLAADGHWLAQIYAVPVPARCDPAALYAHLIALTHCGATP